MFKQKYLFCLVKISGEILNVFSSILVHLHMIHLLYIQCTLTHNLLKRIQVVEQPIYREGLLYLAYNETHAF